MTVFLDDTGTLDDAVVNGFYPDVYDGLTGYYELGGTLDRSLRNWVNPDLPARVVGTPTVEADGVTFVGNSAYFELDIPETADLTFMFVGKVLNEGTTAAGHPAFFGNRDSTNGGLMLYHDGSQASTLNIKGAGSGFDAQPGFTSLQMASWFCASFTVGSTLVSASQGTVNITDHTRGLTNDRTITKANRVPATNRALRLGWAANTSFIGTWKCWRAMLFNRALTSAERATQLAFLRREATASGLSGLTF